jgi:hypothetical protein
MDAIDSPLILGLPLVVYAYIVIKISLWVKKKYIWQEENLLINKVKNRNLISIVKHFLSFFMLLFYAIIVLWLPIMVVMAISQQQIDTWGFDVAAYAGYSFDFNQLPNIDVSGLRNPEISGSSIISMDTSSLYAWYLFTTTQLISAMVALFVLIQLRAMVVSLQNGLSFSTENSRRIKHIGIVTIVWNVVTPLVQYYGWGAFIKDIVFNTEGILFYPAFELNVLGLLVGLLIIILSGLLNEAAQISKEQELTI